MFCLVNNRVIILNRQIFGVVLNRLRELVLRPSVYGARGTKSTLYKLFPLIGAQHYTFLSETFAVQCHFIDKIQLTGVEFKNVCAFPPLASLCVCNCVCVRACLRVRVRVYVRSCVHV